MGELAASWRAFLRTVSRGRRDGDLRQAIYQRHFARWAPARFGADPGFVEQVALSTARAMMWEPGWEVIERAGSSAFVHSGRLRLFIEAASQLRPPRAKVGAQVAVAMPCLREGLMPGFLYAFSRAGAIDVEAPHLRVYLNVDAERGAALMAQLLSRRPFERLSFETKIPSARAGFSRCDTMVVYVEAGDAGAMMRALIASRRREPKGWRSPTPFAALKMAPGIAIAESPPFADGAAQSFGLHRSGLIAQTITAERDRSKWAAALAMRLRDEGIDPARPWSQRLPAEFWAGLGMR